MLLRLCLLFLFPFSLFGQSGRQTTLDRYIERALGRNTGLLENQYQVEQSLAAAREARSAFLPTLALNARYSVARGGRSFDLPLGDLMNPVYRNLNALNRMAGDASPDYPQLPVFPDIDNQQINFLRETEQETFLRLAMPVWHPALAHNRRLQDQLALAEQYGLSEEQRQLVQDVKVAYYQYLKALEGVELYENTLALVRENLRTAESLYRHHQVTVDEVYAARAQVEQVDQELAQAVQSRRVAQAYFNTLLDRPHDEAIQPMPLVDEALAVMPLEQAIQQARRHRETFRQLDHYLEATDQRIQLEQSDALPNLNLAADYGIQGTSYALEPGADYAMGSVILQWNIFDRKRKHRIEQARLARAVMGQRQATVRQQVTLQVIDSYYELETIRERRQHATAEVESARSAYRLVEKKYRQGQANQVDLVNARTQLTRAARRTLLAQYDIQIALAVLERATGSYVLPNR